MRSAMALGPTCMRLATADWIESSRGSVARSELAIDVDDDALTSGLAPTVGGTARTAVDRYVTGRSSLTARATTTTTIAQAATAHQPEPRASRICRGALRVE